MDEISSKIQSALTAVHQIFRETSLLMQTVDGLVTASGFKCPYDSRAFWDISRSFSEGESWLPTYVVRLWQRPANGGTTKALFVSIELRPDSEGERFWFEDVGPVVKGVALTLNKAVKRSEWHLWWGDGAGHDTRLFDVKGHGALYHSTPREGTEASEDEHVRDADNFWLPLTALTNHDKVAKMLVEPLTGISEQGIAYSAKLTVPPYLLLPEDG